MSRLQDRKDAVEIIKEAAKIYKDLLVGKTFMFVFDDRYIEVVFKTRNFCHLTGVQTGLSAADFYKKSLKKELTAQQIWFDDTHPYGLCLKKIIHIEHIADITHKDSFLLEEITTDTRLYKFGTTDLHFTLCMNKEYDADGNEKGPCYVVESLRDEDCFEKSRKVYSVDCIFSKQNDGKLYTTSVFMDQGITIDSLPESVKAQLDPALIQDSSGSM